MLYERCTRITAALNQAVEIFVSHNEETFEDVLSDALRPVAEAAELSRIVVYRVLEREPFKLGQTYRWDKGGKEGGGLIPIADELRVLPDIPVLCNWVSVLSKGEWVNVHTGFMTEDEKAFADIYGIKSMLMFPVFVNGELWGGVTFQDHEKDRDLEREDLSDSLHSTALLCVNAIIRSENKRDAAEAIRALKRGKELTDTLNRAAILFLSQHGNNFKDTMNAGIGIIANVAGLDRIGVFRSFMKEGSLHASQVYRWDGLTGGTTEPTPGLEDVAYDKLAPRWEELLENGGVINSPVRLLPEAAMLQSFGVVSAYIQPVFVNSRFWGFVLFEDRENERFFEEDLAEMMRSAAFLCANTVIRDTNVNNLKHLTDSLAVRLEQQKVTADISNSFVGAGNSDKLIAEALAKLGRFCDVSLVLIFSADYENRKADLAYYWSLDGEHAKRAEFNLFELMLSTFAERLPKDDNTQIVCVPDISLGPEEFRPMLKIGVNAFICVPLYVEGRLWGVFSMEQCGEPRDWTESEKEFVVITASTVAGAIMRSLYEKRLKEALRSAMVASEAKSEFLSNMSHEMRTPLNAIIGMTSIGKKADNAERKDYALGKIENASTHLLGVINDVLDMSKIEAKRFDLSYVEFNFESMLQKIIAMINYRVAERQQTFTVNVDRKVPRFVIGDDQRLSQVIMNLLSNSVKFTPEKGRIELEVFLDGDKDGVCEIRVEVADTGIGISEEQKHKLFHAFGQAESGISREYGGTGLGLAISKQIVGMMNGDIRVESELGKGARFIFTVKLARGTKNIESMLLPGVSWETLRVLAVDDDSAIREFFSDTFERIGVVCDTAADANEALAVIAERGEYDMYFIDWRMPGMDGIGLTETIKRGDTSKPHIVVMISAVDWSEIKDAATRAGVDRYLLKPLLTSAIIDCVNECLGVNHGSETEGDVTGKFAGKKMLLAEDIEINREIVLSLLEETGLVIDCAENGAEAFETVEKSPGKYDIVFMDVQMPKMDGLEATRRIRGLKGDYFGKLPIIAMTANVFKDDIEKCLAAGMDGHIGKPLDIDAVNEKLRKYLK